MTTETDNSLFSIIIDALEAQPYSNKKLMNLSYGDRTYALHLGKPQERLQESELAREIVRLMLDADKPIGFLGSDSSPDKIYAGVHYFDDYTNAEIKAETYGLMREGLLDHGNINGSGPRRWAFESEFDGSYKANPLLRNALRELLRPYEEDAQVGQGEDTDLEQAVQPLG
jgi:hypothetical protein